MGLQTGYKVMWRHPDTRELYSIMFMPGCVRYFLYKWTYPLESAGPLCVFQTLRQARRFQNVLGGEIYPCEFIPAIGVRSVWGTYRMGKLATRSLRSLPSGTVLAACIRLLPKEDCV